MDIYTTAQTGKPDCYIIQGTSIVMNRPFDVASTVGIEFYKEISAVALGDTFLGDERIIQAAKHLARSEYYHEYEEDEGRASTSFKKGMAILDAIQSDTDAREMCGNVEINDDQGL
jgi:hypothetical protein